MTDDKQVLTCNFCGKKRDEVEKLIAGPKVYICDECVKLSYDIVKEELDFDSIEFDFESLPKPNEIKEYLDLYIAGQDSAKEIISVSAYNHYKRISNKIKDVDIEKSNMLVIGPTGSGKTLIAKTLASKLQVPFAIADATTLTEAGYVGEDVESVLERLLSLANFDIELAQRGIVFIDEIDKKSRKGESNTGTRDVGGEGVQQALLRLVEGTITKVRVNTNSKRVLDEFIEFDTSNVLFIVSGAFVGIENLIEKRLKRRSNIGFNSKVIDKVYKKKLLSKVVDEDIVDYGIIPELIGRLPIIAPLEPLSKQDLKNILTDLRNNVIIQLKSLLSIDDIELIFTEKYIDTVAELGSKSKTGARSLKSLIENSIMNIMYRVKELKDKGVVAVRFDDYPTSPDKYPNLVLENNEEKDMNYILYRGLNE